MMTFPPKLAPLAERTVLGIGLASLFSDWSHEMATAVMPAFSQRWAWRRRGLALLKEFQTGFPASPRLGFGLLHGQT